MSRHHTLPPSPVRASSADTGGERAVTRAGKEHTQEEGCGLPHHVLPGSSGSRGGGPERAGSAEVGAAAGVWGPAGTCRCVPGGREGAVRAKVKQIPDPALKGPLLVLSGWGHRPHSRGRGPGAFLGPVPTPGRGGARAVQSVPPILPCPSEEAACLPGSGAEVPGVQLVLGPRGAGSSLFGGQDKLETSRTGEEFGSKYHRHGAFPPEMLCGRRQELRASPPS